MELIDGPDLSERLRHGGLPLDEAVELVAAVADAVAAVHRRGLLHLDVKPANVVLDDRGRPHLVDFGAAQWRAEAAAGPATSVTGTAEYLDPARLRGLPPDERSDVYGLGATCWATLVGRPPHVGSDPAAVLAAAGTGDRPPLEDLVPVPTAVSEVVARALAPEPAERWPDAASFAAALRDAVVAPTPTRELSARRRGAGAPPPRPVLAPEPAAGRTGRRWAAARPAVPRAVRLGAGAAGLAAVVAVLVVVVGPGLGVRGVGDRRAAATDAPDPAAGSTRRDHRDHPRIGRPRPPGPRPRPPAAPSGAIAGCPPRPGELACGDVRAEWTDGLAVVTVGDGPPVRYRLGRTGDQLLLADWDCDGDPDPVLYRPTSGGLYRFHDWPTTAAGTASEPVVLLPADEVAVVADRDGDGCADIGVGAIGGP